MGITDGVLLIFGLGTGARGVYALVTQDIVEDNERFVGRSAFWQGAILVAIGLGLASHAVFHWPWITAVVDWLRSLN